MTTIYILTDAQSPIQREIISSLRDNNYRVITSEYPEDADFDSAIVNDLNQSDCMIVAFSRKMFEFKLFQHIYNNPISSSIYKIWILMDDFVEENLLSIGVKDGVDKNVFISQFSEVAIVNEILRELRKLNLEVSRHHSFKVNNDVSLNYVIGIKTLLSKIKKNQNAHQEVLTFEQRLYENLANEREFGSDSTVLTERSKIVSNLNQLALENLKVSFNDLCVTYSNQDAEVSKVPMEQEKMMYLRQLRTQLGYVNLSRIVEDKPDIQLERIYVPLPVDKTLSVNVQNYRICNWWISETNSYIKNNLIDIFGTKIDTSAIDALIGDVQTYIDDGIDKYYSVPADRPLILAPPWYEGEKFEFWPLYVADIAATIDRLVVIGPPGSGKSSFLRFLALCLVGESLELSAPSANVKSLGRWTHGPLLPIFIELRKFIGWEKFPSSDKEVNQNILFSYIKEEILGENLSNFVEQIKTALFDGHAIFIFDGLDEIPVSKEKNSLQMRQKQIQQIVRSLNDLYPKSRIIISSRDYGYHGWKLDNFVSVNLNPLSLKEMKDLAKNLFTKAGQLPSALEEESNLFLNAISSLPNSLKDRPLFLTLLAIIFLSSNSKALPSTKGDLYYKSILLLLDRWTISRLGEKSIADQLGCDIEDLYDRLEVIAYRTLKDTTNDGSASLKVSEDILVVELFRLGEEASIHKIIAYLSQQSGVLLSPSAGNYEFAHRSFQEYLAASYMAKNEDLRIVKEAIESQPMAFRETCLLIGDALIINQKAGRSKNTVLDLLYRLIDFDIPSEFDKTDPRFWSVWLAAKIAYNTEINKSKVEKQHKGIFEVLTKWMLGIIEIGGLPVPERVELATILGIWREDNRLGVGVKNNVPEISWCRIPRGSFKIGLSKDQIKKIQSLDWGKNWEFTPGREYPEAEIELDEYFISKYPITQEQFNAFVNHDKGYWEDVWWTKEGLDWREKNAPRGRQPLPDWGDRPNFPATNISWYASFAFCNWLQSLMPDFKICLPTEAEWEKAARGIDGRFFPWGNDFDPTMCNNKDTKINSVCPVGCFPLANGPWGENSPIDMCGNVWEWCSTIYEIDGEMIPYPYKYDEREDFAMGDKYLRTVRGGCYLNIPFVIKNTFRGRDKPTAIFGRQGFRIVAHPR